MLRNYLRRKVVSILQLFRDKKEHSHFSVNFSVPRNVFPILVFYEIRVEIFVEVNPPKQSYRWDELVSSIRTLFLEITDFETYFYGVSNLAETKYSVCFGSAAAKERKAVAPRQAIVTNAIFISVTTSVWCRAH